MISRTRRSIDFETHEAGFTWMLQRLADTRDRGGFWVLYRRLERGTFAWPTDEDVARVELRSADLLLLLSGVDLVHTRRRRWYERVA